MKIVKSILLVLFLLSLSGCKTENSEGLAIYLFANDVEPQDLSILSHLELADTPFLTEKDIISYQENSHIIELTAKGIEKIQKLKVPVHGKAFTLCVNHEPIYTGAFWVAYSSISYDGVVIETIFVSSDNPKIQLQLGYPDSSFFQGEDPRADPRIMEELSRVDKLE